MKTNLAKHHTGCMCPSCRSARGESWKTKQKFTASINMILLDSLREWAQEHKTSLTTALEEAIKILIQKEKQEEKRQRIERVMKEEPYKEGIREYTDEEIEEWTELDRIDPELKKELETIRKTRRKKQ